MATIDELIHYCKTTEPLGAFMLSGEWGTGKTYLIEKELTDALKDTHLIVRISMYGMRSVEQLRKAVKEKWIAACSPALGRLMKDREQINRDGGLMRAISGLLRTVNPAAGSAADLMVSLNVMDVVTVEPEIQDIHDHTRKRVVLVFDDIERSKLELMEMMGIINEYCENMGFNTIIVTNEAFLVRTMREDLMMYHMLKGKTVARTVFNVPDFKSILTSIIQSRKWSTETYKEYLLSQESALLDLFASDHYEPPTEGQKYTKSHNLLILETALDDFYRIYYHLRKTGNPNPDPWLYSFVAYALVRKGGVVEKDHLTFDCTDEMIHELYPEYSVKHMTPSIRAWIAFGIWDRERFQSELAEISA